MIEISTYMQSNINNHYVTKYINYINNIDLKGKRNLDVKEKHHIIPRCINIDLYTNIDNIIELTPREHYIAHKILSKCYKKSTNEYNRLICALFAMSKLNSKFNSRSDLIKATEYEKLRVEYINARRIIMKEESKKSKYNKLKYCITNKGKICITNGKCNRYVTDITDMPDGWHKGSTQNKDVQSLSSKLKQSWKINRNKRIGCNHPMYNKGYLIAGKNNGRYGVKLVYVNNGVNNKMIKPEDLEKYLNNGYCRGMIKWHKTKPTVDNSGFNNPAYNTKLMNNGIINKRVPKDDVEQYLDNGWYLGAMKRK